MAPAHIQVCLSQKPSTKHGIIWHVCKLILSVGGRLTMYAWCWEWTTNLLILCLTKYRIRRLVGAGAAAVRWVHCGGSLHHASQEKEMPGIGRAGTDLILAIEFLLDLFRSPARVAKTAFYGGALQ